jgi:uncharacterized protein (DUF2252 family)
MPCGFWETLWLLGKGRTMGADAVGQGRLSKRNPSVRENGRARPSSDERVKQGKSARRATPRSSHARHERPVDSRHPIELLEEQATTRVPELVPIRYGRMLVSPFAYFRGAALPMTADLAAAPTSGLKVQICGDAHLSNFGIFGSPERHLVFDVNDFDETAPGPWEWDVKRLATSLEVAGRDDDFSSEEREGIVRGAVRSYRTSMREFARMSMLDVWYAHLDVEKLLPRFQGLLDPKKTPSVWRAITKARAHDSHQAFDKLARTVGDEPRIVSDPPLIVPIEEFGVDIHSPAGGEWLQSIIGSYSRSLQPDLRHLLDQHRIVHLARKVVGVGSVGTDAWIVLLLDHTHREPLFLQVKQAEASVVERFTSKCLQANYGQRVVYGQRMMQAAGDIFLGWERDTRDGQVRDYYIRQLRDWKGSADISGMTPAGMSLWGRMCGWTLARAHARTGDRVAIASYLGGSDVFERALVLYARSYADQNEQDYAALQEAVRAGQVIAEPALEIA